MHQVHNMHYYHDLAMSEGPLAVLWEQFTVMMGHQGMPFSRKVDAAIPLRVMASWTCADVSAGYSSFCDNWWPIWEIDWVNTFLYIAAVWMWIGFWMLIIGFFQYQKKEAFINPGGSGGFNLFGANTQ